MALPVKKPNNNVKRKKPLMEEVTCSFVETRISHHVSAPAYPSVKSAKVKSNLNMKKLRRVISEVMEMRT